MLISMDCLSFEEIKTRLSARTIGIAGCGGLGSNCAVALARVGIGSLILADFDIVTESNLNRQYYFFDQIGNKKVIALKQNIKRINSSCQIEIHDVKLRPEEIVSLFSKCDVIVEAFDHADQKKMLIETCIAKLPEIPVVCGIGLAGFGGNNLLETLQIDTIYICGDRQSEVLSSLPPLAPRVGIVANMQANQVLEILLKNT